MRSPAPPNPDGDRLRRSGPPSTLYVRVVRPLAGAALVGLLAVPVAAACAVIALAQWAQWRRAGAIFFLQERAGLRGRPFRIVKFRTLREDSAGDLVPTPLGRVLRRTHLDELPQLWNVARGHMSLIGPRPETLPIERWAEEALPGFGERLAIRPGITGLAQVVQDSTPPVAALYAEKLRLNREYLERMGAAMDLWILVRTALRPLRPRAFPRLVGALVPGGAGARPLPRAAAESASRPLKAG